MYSIHGDYCSPYSEYSVQWIHCTVYGVADLTNPLDSKKMTSWLPRKADRSTTRSNTTILGYRTNLDPVWEWWPWWERKWRRKNRSLSNGGKCSITLIIINSYWSFWLSMVSGQWSVKLSMLIVKFIREINSYLNVFIKSINHIYYYKIVNC